MTEQQKAISMVYTNYKGQTKVRHIIPGKIYFGSTDWHSDDQWLLNAYDIDKKASRTFAMMDIKTMWKEL